MEATTTRASTVIKSMPTNEIRTQASMTMPLSNTRSSTSMRLEPPDMRSTAMKRFLLGAPRLCSPLARCPCRPRSRGDTRGFRQGWSCRGHRHGQVWVELPPVQSDLLGLVHRANQKPDADREQFDVRQRNTYVSSNHQALIQDPVKNVYKIGCPRYGRYSFHLS